MENFFLVIEVDTNLRNKNETFKKFCETQLLNPTIGHFTLISLLIMPVQRIPRYVLLLENVLHKMSSDHPDYSSLQSALKKMRTTADVVGKTKAK